MLYILITVAQQHWNKIKKTPHPHQTSPNSGGISLAKMENVTQLTNTSIQAIRVAGEPK